MQQAARTAVVLATAMAGLWCLELNHEQVAKVLFWVLGDHQRMQPRGRESEDHRATHYVVTAAYSFYAFPVGLSV